MFNRSLVRRQIVEAREQLQDLEKRLGAKSRLSEAEFEIFLGHAYHHLNFAWNCRRVPESKYRGLTRGQFRKWGKVPLRVAESLVRWSREGRGA